MKIIVMMYSEKIPRFCVIKKVRHLICNQRICINFFEMQYNDQLSPINNFVTQLLACMHLNVFALVCWIFEGTNTPQVIWDITVH